MDKKERVTKRLNETLLFLKEIIADPSKTDNLINGAYIEFVAPEVDISRLEKREGVQYVHLDLAKPYAPADLYIIEPDEIVTTIYTEVPVVSKEARVVEEPQEVIRDTVRRTDVAVDDPTTGTHTGTSTSLTDADCGQISNL